MDELRTRTAAGDQHATRELIEILARRRRIDEAAAVLRTRAAAGDGYATWRLIDLLSEHRRIDERSTSSPATFASG